MTVDDMKVDETFSILAINQNFFGGFALAAIPKQNAFATYPVHTAAVRSLDSSVDDADDDDAASMAAA